MSEPFILTAEKVIKAMKQKGFVQRLNSKNEFDFRGDLVAKVIEEGVYFYQVENEYSLLTMPSSHYTLDIFVRNYNLYDYIPGMPNPQRKVKIGNKVIIDGVTGHGLNSSGILKVGDIGYVLDYRDFPEIKPIDGAFLVCSVKHVIGHRIDNLKLCQSKAEQMRVILDFKEESIFVYEYLKVKIDNYIDDIQKYRVTDPHYAADAERAMFLDFAKYVRDYGSKNMMKLAEKVLLTKSIKFGE